jgi:chemosensory pili system protein ChpA (sensor histidine kinase/response regulator)
MHLNASRSLPPEGPATPADTSGDLGPLAWVMEELRKCLELAGTALRRQLRDLATAGGAADTGSLPMARLQLHQTAGALDLVGLPAPARVVRAMESAVQAFIDRPLACTEGAAARVERAGFAVADYLDGLLAGKVLSAVGLFPQYQAVLQALGADRIHPADLWDAGGTADAQWAWHLVPGGGGHLPAGLPPPGPALRERLDQAVLRIVKSADAVAARELVDLCVHLSQHAAAAGDTPARSLWHLAAGFFEALGLSLLPIDLYVKRTASRVLVQYAQQGRGAPEVPERLGRDLAFFCAQAQLADGQPAPHLAAVRQAWGLAGHVPVCYELEQFGRFDPLLLAQVRKRLVALRESWAALTGGDASRLRSTCEQFLQLREALVRLHPPLSGLADGLSALARDLSGRAEPPRPELAMEVATSILFLEAACQDFDPADPQLGGRMQRVADRLQAVLQGQAPQPLEPWIEELYRRVSHRQTMGSVVDELRQSLAALEKELDTFSRDSAQAALLHTVPGRLNQMRGVLSVLGLDHAAQAVLHMRDSVQALLQVPPGEAPADVNMLGHNLGALGFLIDMLDHQPALARKLFIFDAVRGELTPVMGRAGPGLEPVAATVAAPVAASEPGIDTVTEPEPQPQPEPQPEPQPQPEWPTPPVHASTHGIEPQQPPVVNVQSVQSVQPVPEDRLKVVGPLHIDQALFNVYLNEADEWSRALQAEVSEWALDTRGDLADSVVAWAHSLCGSSAMIGFTALADLARQMEASLQRTVADGRGTPRHAQVYAEATEEVRRLLHQFAAGFLPEARPEVVQALVWLDDPEAPLAEFAAVEVPSAEASPQAGRVAPVSAVADDELFAFFEEEALELLPLLGGALRQWHARPDNQSARDEVLRTLHTLKGSARLAGALRLGDRAHALESLVEGINALACSVDIEPLLQEFDAFQSAFDALRAAMTRGAKVSEILGSGQALPLAEPPAAEGLATAVATPPVETVAAETPATQIPAGDPPAADPPSGDTPSGDATARPAHAVVRVRAQLLDRLMNQTGEVMITRARLASDIGQLRQALHELTADLERLRVQLRDLELQSELQMQSHRAKDVVADFDPLEFDRYTRVQELARLMAETVGDVASVQRTLQRTVESCEDGLSAQARQTRELQRDLLRTRMLEFDAIADRLHRVVRLAAQESGKAVRLDIQGGVIEIDRGILDRMTPAFEHLLRNAVVHGIEPAAVRAAAGKPATGQLTVRLLQEGNDVSIRFEDDGGGLDLVRIRDKALALGLLPPGAEVTAADAARLVFTPGFSTAPQVSQLAGRGIGMDVVRAEVQAVGGRIDTRTRTGQGACFEVVLPLTTAVTQVVMLRCGDLAFAVPVPLVEGVMNLAGPALESAQAAGQLQHDGQDVPFFWGGALLQSSPRSAEAVGRSVPVVMLRSAAQRLALQVDEVQGRQEVVVKHLGPQLAQLPGLAGVTVLPSGAVVLIYNPVALATVHGEQARAYAAGRLAGPAPSPLQAATDAAPSTLAPLVLVVDDSVTVRRVTQRLLQREGLRVALAGDGLQALEQLALETPALVLSDIEMPRMDGFDLVRNLRGDARWRELPVVMITSRIADKHRDHASALGANHYLGKPYAEDELLALVRRYAAA